MTTIAFTNGRVLTDNGFETNVSVLVEDGHIVAVVPGDHSLRTGLEAVRAAVDEWLANLVAVASAP